MMDDSRVGGRHRIRSGRACGFTLVELLTVISIIALLVALLMPTFTKVRRLAIRTTCMARVEITFKASAQYADGNGQWYPYRPRAPYATGHYLAHQMKGSTFDLNETFIRPYMAKRELNMFCPSRLMEARGPKVVGWNTPSGYMYTYVTYQYFNYGSSSGMADQFPKLYTTISGDKRYPLWGCLTVEKYQYNPSRFLGHDSPETPGHPDGMNAVYMDGSTRWSDWNQMEMFYNTNQSFWWPDVDPDEEFTFGGS